MRKNLHDESGFTLLEILIALTIMTGIIAGIMNFLQSTSKMSSAIIGYSDRENMILTTNQFLRATLANADYVELVDVWEAEHNPEAGYSYLYCGHNGGLTLQDASGNKTELYSATDLDCAKMFVLFKPDQLLPLKVSAQAISSSLSEDNKDVRGYNDTLTTSGGKLYENGSSVDSGAAADSGKNLVYYRGGAFNSYNEVKAYGMLSTTIEVVTWPRDVDIAYNRVKYDTASGNNNFKHLWDLDAGAYNFYLDRTLRGYDAAASGDILLTDSQRLCTVTDKVSGNIALHNTGSVFVQNSYIDRTGSTPKYVWKYTPSTWYSQPAEALRSELNTHWTNITADGGRILTNEGIDGHRLMTNVKGYARCVKFTTPQPDAPVSLGGDIEMDPDSWNVSDNGVETDGSGIQWQKYTIRFKIVNDSDNTASGVNWHFARKVDEIPSGKQIYIDSSSGCEIKPNPPTGNTLTFYSVTTTQMLAAHSSKDIEVVVKTEKEPEPEITLLSLEPRAWDVSIGWAKINVKNPHSSKTLKSIIVEIRNSDGTNNTISKEVWLGPGAETQIGEWDANPQSIPMTGVTPDIAVTNFVYQ